MKNILKSINIKYVLIFMFIIVFIYVSNINYSLRKQIKEKETQKINEDISKKLEESKLINQNASIQLVNSGPMSNSYINFPALNTLGTPVNILSTLQLPYPTTTMTELEKEEWEKNRVEQEIRVKKIESDNKKREDILESLIGCYYGKDEKNGKIQINRNAYFNKYIPTLASSTKYYNTNGSYFFQDLLTSNIITLIPNEESRFNLNFEIGESTFLEDKNNNIFEKNSCSDFIPVSYQGYY